VSSLLCEFLSFVGSPHFCPSPTLLLSGGCTRGRQPSCGGSRWHRCVPALFAGRQRAPGVGGTRPAPACPWGKQERGIRFLAAVGHFCHPITNGLMSRKLRIRGGRIIGSGPSEGARSTVAVILDRRISLPRFHSHCFSSLALSSVPVGFLFVSRCCHL
jgi:hypothetical protein